MVRYWLTPLSVDPSMTISGMRECMHVTQATDLLSRLARLHPRLLPSFKMEMLTSGDDDTCGGSEATPLSVQFEQAGDVELVGPWSLSHCGEAFIERLLPVETCLGLLAMLPESDVCPDVQKMQSWWNQGYRIIMVKEA
jgi:hypothetical protein